jgi:hypothetical protein
VVVPSFTANVQVTGSVRASGRVAVITALVNCEVGGQAHIFVSLTQGTASGNGTAVEQCTSGLVEVPIAVSARGPERFQDGPATASLDAVIQDDGDLIQQQLWTRQVTLTPQ